MPSVVNQATPRHAIDAFVMEADADFTSKFFVADKLAPQLDVEFRKGVYMRARLGTGQLINSNIAPRAQGADYPRISRQYDTDQYDCQEYGLETVVDDSYQSEISAFVDVESTESLLLRRNLLLSYEQRVANLFFNTASWQPTALTSLVAYTEANLATINFAADVALAKAKLLSYGAFPNTLVLPEQVYERLRRSALLQNQVYGLVPKSAGQFALPDEQMVANALGIETLLVARCPVNLAGQNQAYSPGFVWTNTYFWLGKVLGGFYTAGGAARTINWSQDSPSICTTEVYRSDMLRSNVVRVRQNVIEKIIDPTCGILVTTQYS